MSYAKHFYVDRAMQQFNFSMNETVANLIIPFAAFVAKNNKQSCSVSIADALSNSDVPSAVKEYINGEGAHWGKCELSTFEKVSQEDIKNYITDKITIANERFGKKDLVINLPPSLNDLTARLLKVEPQDSVIDLGAGYASFLIHVAKNYSCKKLEGIEIDRVTWLFGSMLAYLEGVNPLIKLGDALTIDKKKKYDKFLVFPPMGCDMEIPFINKVLELLSENGRAVIFLLQGYLFNDGRSMKQSRKELIDGGFLEAVIELPAGVLFPYTAAHSALLVLSKNNKSARLVDASEFYENTRRGASTLTQDAANSIYELINSDSEKSRSIDYEIIKQKDYSFSSRVYFLEEKIPLKGVKKYSKLSDLVETKILRGAQIKASELEEISSDEPTGKYYAFAKDIKNNCLCEELKALKTIDKKLEPIILKEEDILLVMAMTETLKIAYVENLEGKQIIPASNIYIIRLDKTKILPLFFKMLLETDKAFQIFNAFCSGLTIRAISVEFLNKLLIPLPSLDVQNELVKKYRKIEDESRTLQKRLAALETEKGAILDSLF